jgi:hypothetical protein
VRRRSTARRAKNRERGIRGERPERLAAVDTRRSRRRESHSIGAAVVGEFLLPEAQGVGSTQQRELKSDRGGAGLRTLSSSSIFVRYLEGSRRLRGRVFREEISRRDRGSFEHS